MNKAQKLDRFAERRRREIGFDLSAATIAKHTQPAWPSQRGSKSKLIANEELNDFLKRLNYMYAQELEDIELKADVAKLIAAGEIENTQIWIPVAARQPLSSSLIALPGVYDNRESFPRYVSPRSRGKPTPPHISSMEHKQIVHLTAQAISQYERDAKSRRTPPVLCRNKRTGSSPNLVQYTGPGTHLMNIAYGATSPTKQEQKKTAYSPIKQPNKTKKIPVRFERPISAPPKLNPSDSETEDAQYSAAQRSTAARESTVRVPSTMAEEETSDESYTLRAPSPPLIVKLGRELPQVLVERKRVQEKAVVLKEKRKKALVSRRKDELALERKLRFKPRFIQITPPVPIPPPPPPKPRTKLVIKHPKRHIDHTALQFSKLNINNLSAVETGLTNEDIASFVRQSKLTRDMLKINVKKGHLSMVFDEKSLQCERMLRKEIERYRAGSNPTYCII